MHKAEDMVDRAAIDGNSRALRGGKRAKNFVEFGFDAENVHVRARNHNFADLDLAKFDGAEDDSLFAWCKQTAFASLLNLNLQLFGGVRDTVACLRRNSHGGDDFPGNAIEQIDGPAKSVQEPMERASNEKRDAFGACKADRFGDQFADYHVQRGKENERGSKRKCVSQHGRTRSRNSRP